MSSSMIGVVGVGALLILILLQMPLAFALILVGIVAFAMQTSWGPALTFLASDPATVLGNVDLTAVPLFLMMGAFVNVSGFSKDLYAAAAAALGHRRGGLAYSTIAGCATFGAICGSSPATAATFTRVALPEMQARGYSANFAGATIAAGGALKALIPPSLIMILYSVVAKAFIFEVFVAAIIPCVLTILFNLAAIAVTVRLFPSVAPLSPRVPWSDRWIVIRRAAPAAVLILTIFVGLYSGVFTLNEAASVAAVVSLIFAIIRKTLTRENLFAGLSETAMIVGMLYFILIGSSIFTYFISLAKVPEQIVAAVGTLDFSPSAIIAIMLVAYLILGAVFDELAAMIVTLPFALPIIVHLGYDPIWWAIMNVIIVELGLIIPPIGIVILLISAMTPQVTLAGLYRSVVPFIIADVLVLAILTVFPTIALWLPRLLTG